MSFKSKSSKSENKTKRMESPPAPEEVTPPEPVEPEAATSPEPETMMEPEPEKEPTKETPINPRLRKVHARMKGLPVPEDETPRRVFQVKGPNNTVRS